VTFTPGNLFSDELPRGADLVTLVRVLHDHDDDPVQSLLPRLCDSLDSGAQLMVAEPMAGPAAGGVEAYFANYFLAMGQGRLRTYDELAAMIKRAGFAQVSAKAPPVPMLVELLLAQAA
jgi:demethylspheroidene O-methyltransferase